MKARSHVPGWFHQVSFWNSLPFWRVLSLFTLLLFATFLAYEARLIDRLHSRWLSAGQLDAGFMSCEFSKNGFEQISRQTVRNLDELRPLLRMQYDVCRTEKLIRDKFFSEGLGVHFSHSLLARGLLAGGLDSDSYEYRAIERYCDKIIDSNGDLRGSVRHIDDCMVGYVFLDLYDVKEERKYLRASERLIEYLVYQYPKNSIGTMPYFRSHPDVMLVDDKGMVCAFLVRYGTAFNDPKALELGVQQLLSFLRLGIDEATGIPHHAYAVVQKRQMGSKGWLRGIGWLCMGLADTLKWLPKDHAAYEEIHNYFLSILVAVRGYQEQDKCWNWDIGNTLAHTDTSGTAMIGYAIESAISSGVLDNSWAEVSENALRDILRQTHKNGLIDGALADCQGVGHYPKYFGPSNFAQGPTTALFALVLKRQK